MYVCMYVCEHYIILYISYVNVCVCECVLGACVCGIDQGVTREHARHVG